MKNMYQISMRLLLLLSLLQTAMTVSAQITPKFQKCKEATNLSATKVSESSALLQWDIPTATSSGNPQFPSPQNPYAATSQEVYYRAVGSTTWIPKTGVAVKSPYGITNLSANTEYEFYISASCIAGLKSSSNVVRFKTFAPTPPPCPFVLGQMSNIASSSATLNWASKAGEVYTITWFVQGTYAPIFTATQTATSTTCSIELNKLSPSKTYTYTIQPSCNKTGYSAPAEFTTQSATVCTPPTIPLMITKNSDGYFFSAVSPTMEYEIKYHVRGANTWETREFRPTSITQLGWQPNTVYEYLIRLKCSPTSYSAYSSQWTYTTN
jgi:hypothetical protein